MVKSKAGARAKARKSGKSGKAGKADKADNDGTSYEPPLVRAVHPTRPDTPFFLVQPPPKVLKQLLQPLSFFPKCDKACTKVLTLLPKISIGAHSGVGFPMVNVNGFRWLNAYMICDPLTSSNQRGFSLELSFAPFPFVLGVGVVGETSHVFEFDDWFDPGTASHRTIRLETSDLTSTGGVPQIGGPDLTHILRAPVMGPFVRASAFNEGDTPRNAQVVAYLST